MKKNMDNKRTKKHTHTSNQITLSADDEVRFMLCRMLRTHSRLPHGIRPIFGGRAKIAFKLSHRRHPIIFDRPNRSYGELI